MATERKASVREETVEERRGRRLAAIERVFRAADEIEARHGPDTTNSIDLIREAREERAREMMERMGMIPVGDDDAWERELARDRETWRERGREIERADAERRA